MKKKEQYFKYKEEVLTDREKKLEKEGYIRLSPDIILKAKEQNKRIKIDAFMDKFMGEEHYKNILRPVVDYSGEERKGAGLLPPRHSRKYWPWNIFMEAWCKIVD